jgi:hypothetical protein
MKRLEGRDQHTVEYGQAMLKEQIVVKAPAQVAFMLCPTSNGQYSNDLIFRIQTTGEGPSICPIEEPVVLVLDAD